MIKSLLVSLKSKSLLYIPGNTLKDLLFSPGVTEITSTSKPSFSIFFFIASPYISFKLSSVIIATFSHQIQFLCILQNNLLNPFELLYHNFFI